MTSMNLRCTCIYQSAGDGKNMFMKLREASRGARVFAFAFDFVFVFAFDFVFAEEAGWGTRVSIASSGTTILATWR